MEMNAELLAFISTAVASTTENLVDIFQNNWVAVVLAVVGFSAIIAFTMWIIPFKKRNI